MISVNRQEIKVKTRFTATFKAVREDDGEVTLVIMDASGSAHVACIGRGAAAVLCSWLLADA